MTEGVITGSFAHVVGTFDLVQGSGTIDYVTPVRIATESDDVEDERCAEDSERHRRLTRDTTGEGGAVFVTRRSILRIEDRSEDEDPDQRKRERPEDRDSAS